MIARTPPAPGRIRSRAGLALEALHREWPVVAALLALAAEALGARGLAAPAVVLLLAAIASERSRHRLELDDTRDLLAHYRDRACGDAAFRLGRRAA